MEYALDALKSFAGKDDLKNILSLMQVYINNIVRDPDNPKYRKIRISNPKFDSCIWQWEPARTFLLLSGFEQEGDFLVLPRSNSLDGAKVLIDGALASTPSVAERGHGTINSLHEDLSSNVLKLSSQQGESLFDHCVKADLTLLSYMKEMGYNVQVAEKALIVTKNKGIQPAMDWIKQNPEAVSLLFLKPQDTTQAESTGTCHSESSGDTHSSSSEHGPVSRYQKTADERHKFQEKLRLEAIAEARLEKQRKKLHKEYLLKDMRDEKDEKMEKVKQAKLLIAETAREHASIASASQRCDSGEFPQAELRIRIPGGLVSSVSLPGNSTIQTLYQEVRQLWLASAENQSLPEFVLMTSFPQRKLCDMDATIEDSGLTPRAALVVQRTDQQGVVTQGEGVVFSIKNINSMDVWEEWLSEEAKLLVVQFYATWCSSCRSVSDAYHSLNSKYGMNGEVLFARVDVEELKVLQYREGVTSLPTFKLFWNKQTVGQVVGTDVLALEQLIEANKFGAVTGPQNDHNDQLDRGEYRDPR